MRNCFCHWFFVVALCFRFIPSHGQDTTTQQALSQIPEPLYIINSTIIANGLVAEIDPKAIKSIVVYKESSIPEQYRDIAAGIVAIACDGKIKSRSFAAIGRQYGARGPIRVVLNGRVLNAAQAATLRIAPQAVGQVQVTAATAAIPATTVAIRLAVAKPVQHAPGSIMIR